MVRTLVNTWPSSRITPSPGETSPRDALCPARWRPGAGIVCLRGGGSPLPDGLEALDHPDEPNEPVRAELLLSLGEAEVRAGNTPAAKQAFLAAAGIARQNDLPRALGRAAVGYGGRLVWARATADKLLVPLLEEGLAAVGDEDVELRSGSSPASRELFVMSTRVIGGRAQPRGLELARRTRNSTALSYALDGRAVAIFAPDAQKEVLAIGSELRDLAEQIGDTERAIQGHIYRFQAESRSATSPPRRRTSSRQAASPRRYSDQLTGGLSFPRSDACPGNGRFDEAAELITDALALGERAQPRSAIPVYRLQRYGLSEFLEAPRNSNRRSAISFPNIQLALPFAAHSFISRPASDDLSREHALEELTADDFAFLPFDQEWLYGMSLLSETCGFLDHSASAAVLYRCSVRTPTSIASTCPRR